jgi:hypothetical protein
MASKRDRRRIGAAMATVFTGAFVFGVAGAGPVSAATSAGRTGSGCVLGGLLCGILGGGKSTPAPPPKSPGGGKPGGGKAKPTPPPKSSGGGTSAKPKPKSGSSGGGPVPQPFAPAGLGFTTKGAPSPQQTPPLLPDVTSQNPQVVPEAADRTRARLVAATDPVGSAAVSPLLVATASGLGGVVAAFNVSALNHRRRLRRSR